MKKKQVLGMITVATMATLMLTACGGNQKADDKGKGNKETQTEDVSKMPIKVSNTKKAIKDGTLDVAIVTDSSFQGLLMPELSQDAIDSSIAGPMQQTLFATDKDFKMVDGGAADFKLDEDKKIATVTLRENLKWSDGEPVTSDDLVFPYEIIGDKDYTGVRYDERFRNIVGMEEYHEGKADTISGIKQVDDRTMTIEFKEVNPSLLQASGIWEAAAPKHALKDASIKDLASHDLMRKSPLSYGPYVVSKVVNGESIEYTPNKYYKEAFGEDPKLSKITITVVNPSSIVEALKAKKYDIALSMPTDNFPTYKDTEGYEMLGREEMSYTYLGFKMGKWDKDKKENVLDSNAKMSDKNLRQAMGYAINNDEVGQKFYNGLRRNATTLIPTVFKSYHDSDIKGYTQDKEKAKKLLKDAGYKDKDGDGFVEDKDGKKLTIKFASMSGGETAQPLADYYIQEWKDIGLNVELATGRLIDFQSFYDKLQNDDPGIDVYQGAWSTGMDPSPTGLYGRHAAFNMSRFVSEENDKLLEAIDSKDSFDSKKQKKAFSEWQEYAYKEAFVIPTLYRSEVLPVNKRVTDFDWKTTSYDVWAKVGVSDKERQ
ncbi:oligopeptide ABC transporter substrate-binding protein [Vagococcus humatus]|uniref:Oligopeptide ABC transporter substrate-binding protein n=1 Tax=Vagococcus humatus TaxID=1889241 RepID=A0A3R9YE36_9ENTE|nr:oligopeptide ABC transporter substrate-binding protein [Vagococcus humatus]RST89133.1 oligopeptide ABC transporter substrate-binding protein [Vagococcus humatus]